MTDLPPEQKDNEQTDLTELENPRTEYDTDLSAKRVEDSGISSKEDSDPEDDKALSDSPELFQLPGNPRIVSREDHIVTRKLIDFEALKVMYRLVRSGYKAFLVGGAVRDLLLSKKPKDFDIGTTASPEEVRRIFRNSRIIGRRFRMNQVYFRGGKIIEVATFRAQTEVLEEGEPRMLAPDNTYGNEESDALRRDLTINGLFYDPNSYSVIDYVGGMSDLKNRIIRVIGDPDIRFREDPVRMIRAVRHAARTGFTIEPLTRDSIVRNAELITKVVKARVYEEFTRELSRGYSSIALPMLEELGVLRFLMPELSRIYSDDSVENGELKALLIKTLVRIDEAKKGGAEIPASVAFLAICIDSFAAIRPEQGERPGERIKSIINLLYSEVGVTKRDREDMEDTILLCHQLFKSFQQPFEKSVALIKKPLIKEALLLLELTVNNDVGIKALEYWRGLIRKIPAKPKSRHSTAHKYGRRRSTRGVQG